MIALDTETVLIAPGCHAPPLVCLTAADGGPGAALVGWREAEELAVALLDGGELLVGHNVAFDFAVLVSQFPHLMPYVFEAYDADRVKDVGLRAKLIDLAEGSLGWGSIGGKRTRFKYSLDELTRRHFGLALDKDGPWRLRYGELRDVPVEQWPAGARQYAIDDAVATAHVWQAQEAHRDIFADLHRQARAEFWIRLMSCWGMTTSPAAVAEFERMARENYVRLAAVLVEAGLKRPDRVIKVGKRKGEIDEGARDTKAAMVRLVAAYEARGVPVPMTEGTEKTPPRPSLEEDACFKSGDPVLHAYGEFGSASKVLSTDVPLVQAGTAVPIHAHFETLLETGDIGCSAPNLVNLPTRHLHVPGSHCPAPVLPCTCPWGVRECFVPRPGFVFLACDYAAIQLRTWAQVCIWLLGGSRMAEVLNAGGDPHCMVAADILGTTYEDALARKAEVYYERQCGKVANFGLPGGMGPARLVHAAANQYQIEITEHKARALKETWRRTWPEAQPYLDLVGRMTDRGNIQIKQFLSERVRGGLGYCDTANTLFSALAYDAIKAAGWLVSKACYVDTRSVLLGSRICNVVHDELLLESPEDIASECADELARLMCEGAAPWLPDVPPKAEPVLMRRWSKKAASKRGADGKWTIWE